MEWAARGTHLGGIPRKSVFAVVGLFAKAWVNLFNTTSVHNADTLVRLVRSRPPGVPLITVSNHMSTMDDPLMWGFRGFPITDSNLARWALAAEDICFKNRLFSYFFRLVREVGLLNDKGHSYNWGPNAEFSFIVPCLLGGGFNSIVLWSCTFKSSAGKCIPITRGAGIYQEHMNEALERLRDGQWLHFFPQGKVSQEDAPIRRLKWGAASLIARSSMTPIVLPIVHHGFEEVMPEKYWFGRRPPFPLCNKRISITVGEPIEFNLPKMRERAVSMSGKISVPSRGWPKTSCGLDEKAQVYLYMTISDEIRTAMESLRIFGKNLLKKTSRIQPS